MIALSFLLFALLVAAWLAAPAEPKKVTGKLVPALMFSESPAD